MTKTLIFIPCYNVERKIKKVFNKIPKKIINNNKIKFLFIDDKSKDNTLKIIRKIKKNYKNKVFILSNSQNHGYGYVQKIAFKYSPTDDCHSPTDALIEKIFFPLISCPKETCEINSNSKISFFISSIFFCRLNQTNPQQ